MNLIKEYDNFEKVTIAHKAIAMVYKEVIEELLEDVDMTKRNKTVVKVLECMNIKVFDLVKQEITNSK